jgi:hypothetical protein
LGLAELIDFIEKNVDKEVRMRCHACEIANVSTNATNTTTPPVVIPPVVAPFNQSTFVLPGGCGY